MMILNANTTVGLRRSMVPIADVKRALAEARGASRVKLEEALSAANGSWVQRVVQLEGRLQEAEKRDRQVRGWAYRTS